MATYRNETYDATGLAERVRITVSLYERWVRPDFTTPVESRPPTATELALLDELGDAEDTERARRNAALRAALANVLATGIGHDLVTILVGGGVVPIKAAKAEGWVPPA
jgi:hypothetical protein